MGQASRQIRLPRSIPLATRTGRAVPNVQDLDLPPHRVRLYLDASKRRFPRAELRRLPTGCYNCHGLTFASRRTQILDPSVVEDILKDDGYRRIRFRGVMQGDLAVYYDRREIAHTGVIVAVERDERILGGGAVKESRRNKLKHLSLACRCKRHAKRYGCGMGQGQVRGAEGVAE